MRGRSSESNKCGAEAQKEINAGPESELCGAGARKWIMRGRSPKAINTGPESKSDKCKVLWVGSALKTETHLVSVDSEHRRWFTHRGWYNPPSVVQVAVCVVSVGGCFARGQPRCYGDCVLIFRKSALSPERLLAAMSEAGLIAVAVACWFVGAVARCSLLRLGRLLAVLLRAVARCSAWGGYSFAKRIL
ncbi:hypothetical protein CRG98_028533 [Punica granatum]|uniref:Uncharacterized protein n=1 Tax=Punica granatum TaxID=22663 RepID=A0A2I0J4F7_PUNGR|nr:hypothetical protein CRG98_028533 [Punica granatum]